MISIDQLTLRLPEAYQTRANAIALQTAQQLAKLPQQQSLTLAQLQIPMIKLKGGEADGVIARNIAQAIHQQIGRQAKGGGL